MLEQILPLLISLKVQLEQKRSVLLRDLMVYFKVIMVNFKSEMEQVLADNPRLKREIEYDLRHLDSVEAVGLSRSKSRVESSHAADRSSEPLDQHPRDSADQPHGAADRTQRDAQTESQSVRVE